MVTNEVFNFFKTNRIVNREDFVGYVTHKYVTFGNQNHCDLLFPKKKQFKPSQLKPGFDHFLPN